MPITNFILGTNFIKVVNYADNRSVVVMSNRDPVNAIEWTYEPNAPIVHVFTLDPMDSISLIKALGNEVDKAIYARAVTASARLEVIEHYE